MASAPTRAVNLARQLAVIRAALPATIGAIRRGELDCRIPIQPSPACQTYTVRLRYRHGKPPRVTVVDPPVLERHRDAHALPHAYPGDELCLYFPGQWRHDMLLAYTILPWTAEWLIHYELWLVTGTWTAGGRHPRRRFRDSRRRSTHPAPRRRASPPRPGHARTGIPVEAAAGLAAEQAGVDRAQPDRRRVQRDP
jgi:hypothetical protein